MTILCRCALCDKQFEAKRESKSLFRYCSSTCRNKVWIAMNPERRKQQQAAYQKKRFATDPEFRQKHLERLREWGEKNPEKLDAANKKAQKRYRAKSYAAGKLPFWMYS